MITQHNQFLHGNFFKMRNITKAYTSHSFIANVPCIKRRRRSIQQTRNLHTDTEINYDYKTQPIYLCKSGLQKNGEVYNLAAETGWITTFEMKVEALCGKLRYSVCTLCECVWVCVCIRCLWARAIFGTEAPT